ncbi:hypothetical protein VOLCADRAFT_105328 [Volvox carteri f. nagariensis]|uniref:Proteasome activator complex subunit 4 C-terminal domain-containing protein n=1 Tax=Volvox carteri f. nagariensis TaxID=3068 RepID=D8U030_VOLCA|nr:uncharacterized protein VOLCADRAFT_105328 [Volvox carteri f. nagariensis]EFJ46866.1 hypothetical protein VOLCADRAFT_105328 [Volvox carteri f. nagariensis]|eukprot:XP_002952075.1 hypothetical protein VOLCADRAFT_105328 [Volvox carteri f. nagariensis]
MTRTGPELQKFAREFHATLLVVRSLSLNTHADGSVASAAAVSAGGGGTSGGSSSGGSGAAMLAAALDALSAAAVVEVPWSARAAALSYAQTLWFRHAPLLTPEQLRNLQEVVAARLQDAKAEVRTLAAATLSGLLRGTAPEDVTALRNRLLEKAAALFGGGGGSRRRRGGDAGPAAAAAAASSPQQLQLEKLGCVAGLSALLMSCPYDVPAWLPPVLMALVRAAGGAERDGAIRGEAGRALGEFRRTHEPESLEDLRAKMDPDDWDSFTQATGTASYFA